MSGIAVRVLPDERRCVVSNDLNFQDTIYASLSNLKGIAQALRLVTDDGTEYYMCHLFSDVIDAEINNILDVCPEEWNMPKSLI